MGSFGDVQDGIFYWQKTRQMAAHIARYDGPGKATGLLEQLAVR